MSAAITTPVAEPEASDPSVHDWLTAVRTGGAAWPTPGPQPLVAGVCSAAVDPLEIAAALEAAGMSHQVVNTTYGQPDVFTLAGELWRAVPFRAAPAPAPVAERRGNWHDLARGALYGAPSLLLFALVRAAHLQLAWWALPLALTWGWGLGQVAAHIGYTLRGRGDGNGEVRAMRWMLLLSAVSTPLMATAFARLLAGDPATVLVTASVNVYMVASAVLLLNERERQAALLLTPGLAAVVLLPVLGSNALLDALAIAAVSAAAAATVVAAARQLRAGGTASPLAHADLVLTAGHLGHGLFCGLALSVVAILGARLHSDSGSMALLALPLLVTLGVMEWQLRTFKAESAGLRRTLAHLDQFSARARAAFWRCMGVYVLAVVLTSAAVAVAVQLRGDHHPPYGLLVAQIALGAVFYLDVAATAAGRLSLVLGCWGAGALAAGACAAWTLGTTAMAGDAVVWRAAVVGTVVTLVALLACLRELVASPTSY